MKNICDNAEKCLNEYRFTDDYDYRISDVFISELKDSNKDVGGSLVSLVAEAYYKGIAFNDYGNDSEYDGEKVNMSLFAYDITMDYAGENILESYNTGWGSLGIKSVNKADSIIDLNSAIDIVNSQISGFNELNIYKIIPLYALYPKEVSDPDIREFPWTGQEVLARPVYAFIIESDKMDENEFLKGKSYYYYYIFVDMIDGTIKSNIGEKKKESANEPVNY